MSHNFSTIPSKGDVTRILTKQESSSEQLPVVLQLCFVDDERRILDGLRRMLRNLRKYWNMTFFDDPIEALKWIKENPVDVVVSDMRMPQMDGVSFLEQIQEICPNALRFILSGNSKRQEVLRASGPVHQYLAKPCDPQQLQQTIMHTLQLRTLITPISNKTLSNLEYVPRLSGLQDKLRQACQNRDNNISDIARLVEQDPGLTSRILKMINSPFFGINRLIVHVEEAINILGIEALNSLVLADSVFTGVEDSPHARVIWNHSLRCAGLAKNIARDLKASRSDQDIAFFSGLMHDLGIIILLNNHGYNYSHIIESSNKHGIPLILAEEKILKCTHATVSAYVLSGWGISDEALTAILHHHDLHACDNIISLAVAAADIIDSLANPLGDILCHGDIEDELREVIGPERLSKWQQLHVQGEAT